MLEEPEHHALLKAIGVFAGLMIPLGSAGIVSQFMSGLVTVYSRALRPGELVRTGEVVGVAGAVVTTTVTIGYDAPWRQVHALLLTAAGRTPGALSTPEPYVLQRALSDFYVEYELRVCIDRVEERFRILSDLYGQIQDAFNEVGVQIMSPRFETQPAQPVVVPRARWYEPPAARPARPTHPLATGGR